jgi:hypothetical protein
VFLRQHSAWLHHCSSYWVAPPEFDSLFRVKGRFWVPAEAVEASRVARMMVML